MFEDVVPAGRVSTWYSLNSTRPHWPVVTILKVLFVQKCWGLSDPAAEEMLRDRLSFRRFVGLSLDDFIEASLNQNLDVELIPIPPKHLARWRRLARKALGTRPLQERQQLEHIAREQGHPKAVELLIAEHVRDQEAVWVTAPLVGKGHWIPSLLWQRVEEWLQVYYPVWTGDPVGQPGFLDSLPDGDPYNLWDTDGELAAVLERYPQLCLPPVCLRPARCRSPRIAAHTRTT